MHKFYWNGRTGQPRPANVSAASVRNSMSPPSSAYHFPGNGPPMQMSTSKSEHNLSIGGQYGPNVPVRRDNAKTVVKVTSDESARTAKSTTVGLV